MFIFLPYNKKKMEDSSYFHELKKQASFFFKQNVKMARLALTDVTPVQLLTEEATGGNPLPPDSPTMRKIIRAAFEVDEYYRIVEILHKRLEKFEAKDWRASYNAVVLLEHALTHGPQSFAEEFEDHKHVLREMDAFHFVDDKGFNWGKSVRNLSARVLKLVEHQDFLKQERIRARSLTREIQGFGNLTRRSIPTATGSHSEPGNGRSPAREILPIDDEKEVEIKEINHPFSEEIKQHHQVSQSLISSQ